MGWFKKIFERRSIPEDDTIDISDSLLRALMPKASITSTEAMNIPALAGCVEFISNTIAMLPIKLYRENGKAVEEVQSDPRLILLNDETGDLLTSFQMKKAFIRNYLLDGNGYIYIKHQGNSVKSLHYVSADSVSVNTNNHPIFKQAEIHVLDKTYYDFEFIKLTRNTVDGVRGAGIIQEHSVALSASYNEWIYENVLVKNGGNKKGFLQSAKRLDEKSMEVLKDAWRNLYSNNQNNVMVLNDGLTFKESSNTLVEMQLNENKKTNADEICKLFNLSSNIINGKATEDEYVSGFKSAILPILKSFEAELNKMMLLECEKECFYYAFDTSEPMKGDLLKRYQAYKLALTANFMQPEEVRYKEDLSPLGLDFIKMGLQDVMYFPETHTFYTPNTNKTTKIDGKGGEEDETGNQVEE